MSRTPGPSASPPPAAPPADGGEEEDDDYMTMTFADAPPAAAAPETSLQRRERERREAQRRGRPKSKAELEAEAAAARDAALSRSLLADPAAARRSKGFAMMARMGFRAGGTLGSGANREARAEPLRIAVKGDRGGVGLDAERKRKAEAEEDPAGEKRPRGPPPIDERAYRERVGREREQARKERLFDAAQKVAERMEEERGGEVGEAAEGGEEEGGRRKTGSSRAAGGPRTISSRPLKSINVLWRGAVRAREEAERDRRMRHDLEQGLSRLPTYEDDSEDDDDRRALGRAGPVAHEAADDLDDEDPELEAFAALDVDERLRRIVEHLRGRYHYCFWCKYTYEDAGMEGCPGVTEEDHD